MIKLWLLLQAERMLVSQEGVCSVE